MSYLIEHTKALRACKLKQVFAVQKITEQYIEIPTIFNHAI